MTNQDPICPNCFYSLKGHIPIEQADPKSEAKITCPECGHHTTQAFARATPHPNKHPILTALLAAFVLITFTSCCISLIFGDMIFWLIGYE